MHNQAIKHGYLFIVDVIYRFVRYGLPVYKLTKVDVGY